MNDTPAARRELWQGSRAAGPLAGLRFCPRGQRGTGR